MQTTSDDINISSDNIKIMSLYCQVRAVPKPNF